MKSGLSVLLGCILLGALPAEVDLERYDSLQGLAALKPYTKKFSALAGVVSSSTEVTVYEGLPHHLFEVQLFKKEAKRSDIFWLHGIPFYEKPLAVTNTDLERLRGLYIDPKNHRETSGMKLCGGFHPDYCITWRKGSEQVQVLVCLGCADWLTFSGKRYLYEEFPEGVWKELRGILTPYVAQRPKSQVPEPASLDLPEKPDEKR
jgi:hypothetical protein